MTVWKYNLPIRDDVSLSMPVGARVLSAQAQGDEVCLWALVDPGAQRESRGFAVRGTGHDVGEVGEFIATVQTHNGALVWHIFEARHG